ncbi:hypothetical protein [Streptomyces sp. CAU 1734]|uniref:hypothetical protein n=1 Tax=Streptomyces sp. CAU 1734 TaxID=3140360 RepID=UPI00326175B7
MPDRIQVLRLAAMVAGRELDAALNHADLSSRFPDPDLRQAVIAEALAIARRLMARGAHPDAAGGQQPATSSAQQVPCSTATLRRTHAPHDWQPQPGMTPVHCPGTTEATPDEPEEPTR